MVNNDEARGPVRAIRIRVWPRDVQTGEAPCELLLAAGCADRLLSPCPRLHVQKMALPQERASTAFSWNGLVLLSLPFRFSLRTCAKRLKRERGKINMA